MRKAIAIDFDGCLCKNAWPDIGEPNRDVIQAALEEKHCGTALILWTCRAGDLLDAALAACSEWGLTFDAANENLSERIEHYGTESRKVSADEYWDDCAVHMPLPSNAPMTLDELMEVDGEPVFFVSNLGERRWGIIRVYRDDSGDRGVEVFFSGFQRMDCWNYGGDGWLAYRRRPEDANK